jgi:hypothetical protein
MSLYRFLLALAGLIFSLKSFETLVFTSHGDALYYHLPFGFYVYEFGMNWTLTELCGALMTGLFDHLYIITVNIMPERWQGQLLSQFAHYFFSMGLGSIILFYHFRENKMIAALASLSLLTLSSGASYFFYAKNDGPLALAVLIAAIFICYPKNKTHPLIIGLLLGLLPLIKLSGLFATIPLSLIYAFDQRKKPPHILLAATVAFTVWSPLLWRNWYYSGTPFFPGLLSLFPGEVSEAIIETYASYVAKEITVSSFFKALQIIFMPKLIIALGLLFVTKESLHRHLRLFICALSYAGIYLLINGGVTSYRFFFPVMFLMTAFVFHLMKDHPKLKLAPKAVWIILLMIILADSKIDNTIKKVKRLPQQMSALINDPDAFIYEKSTNAQIWQPLQGETQKFRVITDGYNEVFYAPTTARLHCVECNNQAAFLWRCDQDGDLEKLQSYEYAILQEHHLHKAQSNPCYQQITQSLVLKKVPSFNTSYILYKL